jgi:hypothetical protein
MKLFCTFVLLCSSAFAVQAMEKATVYSMHKVPCEGSMPVAGMPQQPGMPPIIMGGDGRECTEYELRTAKVSYIIRPRHEVLLMLGGEVLIRLAQSELLVLSSNSPKEIHCAVLAMSLRSETERRERDRSRVSHTVCFDEQGRVVRCPEMP